MYESSTVSMINKTIIVTIFRKPWVPGLPCYAAQTLALTGKMENFSALILTVLSFYSFYTFSDPRKFKA
jgi:hypothetical protein